jgi:hypothetical protein
MSRLSSSWFLASLFRRSVNILDSSSGKLSNKDSEHLLNATIDTLIYLFACVGAGILYHLSYGESFITMFIRSVIIIGFFTWYLHSRLETMRTLQAQRQDSHD